MRLDPTNWLHSWVLKHLVLNKSHSSFMYEEVEPVQEFVVFIVLMVSFNECLLSKFLEKLHDIMRWIVFYFWNEWTRLPAVLSVQYEYMKNIKKFRLINVNYFALLANLHVGTYIRFGDFDLWRTIEHYLWMEFYFEVGR